MNKFGTVIGHTFISRFKTKSFLITTLITVGLIVALANIQGIINTFSGEDKGIAVIDQTGKFYDGLEKNYVHEESEKGVRLYKTELDEKAAKEEVESGDMNGLLVLTEDQDGFPVGHYYAEQVSETWDHFDLEQALQQLKTGVATEKLGLRQKDLAVMNKPVEFKTTSLAEGAKTDDELNQARGIVYVLLFVLYFTIMFYGNMIATDIATEKSSRVMEIIVSSVSPVTHMFGKIIGIALLGISQLLIFGIVGFLTIVQKKDELIDGAFTYFGVQDISVSLFVYAIVFFLLGYFLYATLAAMLGSLVSRVEDVQLLMTPMIFLVVIGFMIAIFGLGMPSAKFVTFTSFIPFFSPMIMFLRVGMLDIPAWEIALSIGLLILTTVILGILGARIYKGGVLLYGASSSFKDFKRAFSLSKKED